MVIPMINNNYFESPFKGIPLSEQVTNPNIIVGRYSYYSGYYHGHSFDDCARYLMPNEPGMDKLVIGSFCSIGSGVSFIMAGNQGHRMEWVSTFPFFYTDDEYTKNAIDGFQNAGDTEIGHDVWIGAEAMIMPGIKIGHGALIGARSVVTKNVDPYTIVAGNPAKPIRKRFSEEQIKQLLTIEWWNWPEDQLASAMNYLCSTDINGLFNFWMANQK
ncbi:chloramphenicol acetyltransferase [Legionella quateirensis]|uniref:Chloramphenicol acetyltransferase n=2 Tax=Legionella quateirensis TaxID=45072 RepID=A0A378KXR3_9GAMM|nr:chloramphenicol acetyltransferase [Legionella quateirensis]STY19333.1 chloramphenicol acetyltransferase [Legionella quateirensis]